MKQFHFATSCLTLAAWLVFAPLVRANEEAPAVIKAAQWKEERGDYAGALAIIDKAMKRYPSSAELHAARSEALWQQQENDQAALAEIDMAVTLQPKQAMYQGKKAEILLRLNRKAEALDAVNKAIQLPQAGSVDHFIKLKATLLEQMNRLNEAEKCLDQVLKSLPQDRDTHSDRARVAAKLGHWQKSLADCDAVIELRSTKTPMFQTAKAYGMRADALAHLHQMEKAKAAYLEIVKLWPDDRQSLDRCRVFFESIGDKQNASTVAKKMKTLDDDILPSRGLGF